MLGNSKNSKWGLFGNLEKRSMQWSHNMLDVCKSFLVFVFNLENALKMPLNLTRARSGVLELQK
jgi:hypothetical protein